MQTAGLIILGIYLLIMVLIGVVAARFQKSTADFWVANRGFGAFVLAAAIMASIMHGGTMVGGTGQIGAMGAITLNNLSFALGFLVVLFFMAEKLRKFGGFTLPDFLGERYESNGMRAFGALVILVTAIVSLIAQTKSMGIIVQKMTGLPPEFSLILATAIFVFYTTIGGMMAAVWTDIAQWVFMMVGVIALALGLWPHVGGWSTAVQAAEKAAPGWTALTGIGWTPLSLFSWYFVWFIAYFTRIEFVTKMYTARDARAARLGTAWGLILILLFINFMVYFGAAARVLIWDKIKSPDQALPTLMATYLSPFWEAVALSGVAAAAMSTVSSLLLLSGAAISHDFLRKSYFEPRGIVKSEGYYLAISRLTLLAVGLVALAGAFKTPTLVLTIVSYAVALSGAAFAMPMLLGLVWRRTSSAAALASSVGGFLGSAFWAVATEMGYAWAKAMHPIIPGFVISLVLILAVSFFTSPSSKETLQRFFPA
ncbi:MAG: hypothetical protein IMW96_11500 [Thermoanaerobacteraceae bacterium]|nr:hypothetical protein [Thermoanaerobacteraceae bacterium]